MWGVIGQGIAGLFATIREGIRARRERRRLAAEADKRAHEASAERWQRMRDESRKHSREQSRAAAHRAAMRGRKG